jgi:hypothetical protein
VVSRQLSRSDCSAAGFRLRDITFDLFEIDASNGANQNAPAIINVNLRNRVEVELPCHWRSPIDDADLAQRNLRIASRHLLQTWRELSARPAPVGIKIDNGHVPECEMLVDVHLRAMRNHFDRLAATGDAGSCL